MSRLGFIGFWLGVRFWRFLGEIFGGAGVAFWRGFWRGFGVAGFLWSRV